MFSTSINLKQGRIRFYLLISMQFLFAILLHGQGQQVDRFEIAIANNENSDFSVVSAGENGLMVYRRLFESKIDKLEITRVDTALQQQWTKKIEVARGLQVTHATVKDNFLFILFKSINYKFVDFIIIAVDISDGEFVAYQVKNLIYFNPTEFIITDKAALIGGYFNYRPLMVYFNFVSQQAKIMPGFFNEPGELTQIKTYSNGFIDVIVSTDNYEKKRCLWIRNYDAGGDLIKTTILTPEDKKNLIFGRSIQIGNDQQAVVGVYGRFKEYSRGIFIARVAPNGEYEIQYHDYGELEHFFNYMKATRVKRIKGRIERKKIKGKKAKFNYRLIVHEVINTHNDNYIMLGEAFYPKYSYTNGVTQNRILIGYQYTHAVVIGFDENGKLTWDNSFEINDVKTSGLEQFVKIHTQRDKIILQYVYQNQIRSKIIRGSEIIEGNASDDIKLKFKDDIVKDTNDEANKLDYWYNGRLFVYGVQQIKNWRELKVNASRKVFFVNKIQYK